MRPRRVGGRGRGRGRRRFRRIDEELLNPYFEQAEGENIDRDVVVGMTAELEYNDEWHAFEVTEIRDEAHPHYLEYVDKPSWNEWLTLDSRMYRWGKRGFEGGSIRSVRFPAKTDDPNLVKVDPDAGPYAHMNMHITAPDQGEKKFEIICSYGPYMNRGVWQHKVDRIKKFLTTRFTNWGISVQYKYDPTETNWENHGDVVLSSKDDLQLGTEDVIVEKWIEVEKEPEEENADAAEENGDAGGENANAAEENAVADAQENANVADENGDANAENVDASGAEDGGGVQKEPEKTKEMVKKLVSETIQKPVDDYILKEYLHNRNHGRLYHNAEEAARKISVIFNARYDKQKQEEEDSEKREPSTKPSEDVKVSEDSSSNS